MGMSWHNHPTSRTWQLPDGYKGSLKPVVLLLGKESPPLEVVVASAPQKPTKTDMRDLWQRRHQNRPATMLLVAEYPTSGDARQVIVCGKPSAHRTEGDDTTLVVSEPLDLAQVERFTTVLWKKIATWPPK